MPAWRDHSPANLAAIAEVVRGLSVVLQEAEPSNDQLALGERIFTANCVECHGDEGSGDGFAADDFPIAPGSFRGARPSLAASVRVLQSGVQGTPMAPWTDRLNAEELLAVAHYVRQFFVADQDSTGESR